MLSFPEGKPAEKKPWSTPTVEEVPWDTLPTEVRMLVLGLPDAGVPPQVVVPDQAEKAPPAADVIDEAWKAKWEAAAEEKQPVEPPAQPVSAPDPVPATPVSAPKPMLPGDAKRARDRARNREVVERENAKMRAGLH